MEFVALPLEPAIFRNIAERSRDLAYLADRIPNRRTLRPKDLRRALTRGHPEFHRRRGAAGLELRQPFRHRLAIGLADVTEHAIAHGRVVRRQRVPDAVHLFRPGEFAGREIELPAAHGRDALGVAEPRFALAQPG